MIIQLILHVIYRNVIPRVSTITIKTNKRTSRPSIHIWKKKQSVLSKNVYNYYCILQCNLFRPTSGLGWLLLFLVLVVNQTNCAFVVSSIRVQYKIPKTVGTYAASVTALHIKSGIQCAIEGAQSVHSYK